MTFTVPWDSVRNGIHLAYNYVEDIPQDFGFISAIEDEDLENLETYCRLQIQYNTPVLKNELDWGDILRFILIEIEYREENNL